MAESIKEKERKVARQLNCIRNAKTYFYYITKVNKVTDIGIVFSSFSWYSRSSKTVLSGAITVEYREDSRYTV